MTADALRPEHRELLARVVAGDLSADDAAVRAAAREPAFAQALAELLAVQRLLDDTAADERSWQADAAAADDPGAPAPTAVVAATLDRLAGAPPRGRRWWLAAVAVAAALLLAFAWWAWPGPRPVPPRTLSPAGLELLPAEWPTRGGLRLRWRALPGLRATVTIYRPGAAVDAPPLAEHDTRDTQWELSAEEARALTRQDWWRVEVGDGTRVLETASAPLSR